MRSGRPLSLGIIGAGAVVRNYHLPALAGMDELRICWVCDLDEDRAHSIARAAGVRQVYSSLEAAPDVDLVLVAVPVGARRDVVATLVARGWHALCEKPFAASSTDHHAFIDAAGRRRIRLGVGLVRRFYSSTRVARRMVSAELLGAPTSAIAGEGQRVRRTGRDADWYQASAEASGGGVLAETGSHLVDQLFSVCDASAYEIDASRQRTVDGLEFETAAGGSMITAAGRRIPFDIVVSRERDIYNGIVIRCRNGELRLGLSPGAAVELRSSDGGQVGSIPCPFDRKAALIAAFQAQWRAFVDTCATLPGDAGAETGLLTTSFIEDCYRRSAASTGAYA